MWLLIFCVISFCLSVWSKNLFDGNWWCESFCECDLWTINTFFVFTHRFFFFFWQQLYVFRFNFAPKQWKTYSTPNAPPIYFLRNVYLYTYIFSRRFLCFGWIWLYFSFYWNIIHKNGFKCYRRKKKILQIIQTTLILNMLTDAMLRPLHFGNLRRRFFIFSAFSHLIWCKWTLDNEYQSKLHEWNGKQLQSI